MPIDHKFKITATRISDGKVFTEEDCEVDMLLLRIIAYQESHKNEITVAAPNNDNKQ